MKSAHSSPLLNSNLTETDKGIYFIVPAKKARKSIVVLGDSTIDNKIWVDGLLKNYLCARLGIKPDDSLTRIKKAKNLCFKPELSVVEHLMSLLPNDEIFDFANDGFTTHDCLNGALRSKVFGSGTFPQFPDEFFNPLVQQATKINHSDYIILSVGGNDIREFLQTALNFKNDTIRKEYIKNNFQNVISIMQKNYLAILDLLKKYNNHGHIILMTQYYPSFHQNNYKIYPFMTELGKALNIGKNPTNPMDVIHEIMKQSYTAILQSELAQHVSVVDITSSLNPFDKANHVAQIEPSGAGGKKIAQMLQYAIQHPSKGHVFQFQPEFFTQQQSSSVEIIPFKEWHHKHPLEFIGKACHNPTMALQLLTQFKSDDELSEEEINEIKESQTLSQALIVLHQTSAELVTYCYMRKIMQSEPLQKALSTAHDYLNSGRFGLFRTHGGVGITRTKLFIQNLLQLKNPDEISVREEMQNWLQNSNVHNSSRTFYAFKSGLFPLVNTGREDYVNNTPSERKKILDSMLINFI